MTKKHKELMQMVLRLSNMDILYCNLNINRRNGYYCVDKYSSENGKFIGTCFCGTYIETYHYLQGMLNTAWLIKPF